ncbi:hypothetical protein C1646_772546 [Rhizophagus diaphanus]|nr:hypothetical protein C1646_772546 [Rhizophagus diaphanus] [Rhizophagus sp. MUCL 43196]
MSLIPNNFLDQTIIYFYILNTQQMDLADALQLKTAHFLDSNVKELSTKKEEFQELQVTPTHIVIETPEKIKLVEIQRSYALTDDKVTLKVVTISQENIEA